MPGPAISFIGAGSTVFARNLLGDILSLPALQESDIRLFDIESGGLCNFSTISKSTYACIISHQTFGISP